METPAGTVGTGASGGLCCPECRGGLTEDGDVFTCAGCGTAYPAAPFPDFLPPEPVAHEATTDTHRRIASNEDRAMVYRAECFYAPKLRARYGRLDGLRVLDDGCGSGVLVDELNRLGMDAWGIDPFNRWNSWQQRQHVDRLARADGLKLPFADGWFDVLLSNGVLEHIGHEGPGAPHPDRAEKRQRYVAEALRVLRPGGTLLLAHPNGACPLDFWHGGHHSIRPHRPYETYMPNPREVRGYIRTAAPAARIRVLSAHDYVSKLRVSNDPLGRKLLPAANVVLWLARRIPPLRRSPLNPLLVTDVVKPG